MQLAKFNTVDALDSMKSPDPDDSIETLRQASGKETVLPFSRGDTSGQWFQLLNVLDQPEIPGWPLLIPQKIQMQKCEKCSREFCAPINYRRHVRVHRRSLNVDKDSHKIRDMLAAFWDKLTLEKAKEVVSFNDVTLKEVPGSSVIKAWGSSIRKPGVWTLPQDYVKSGSTLLDVINAKPSRLPISSQELFYILDDASEKTFLCAGTAESVQKFVFDGDVTKIALELKNLVASMSFLFEKKLVKAWLADKDAEALRCQKLLVAEEEAAHKKQADLVERKKQRKLRQKEQKEKDQSVENAALDITVNSLQGSPVVETFSHSAPSESNSEDPDTPADVFSFEEPVHSSRNETLVDSKAQTDLTECSLDSSSVPNAEPPVESTNGRRRWRVPKSQRNRRNGFHDGQDLQSVQVVEPSQKHAPPRERDRGLTENNHKVWTKKFKVENNEDIDRSSRSEGVAASHDENKCELIIGSISVSLPARKHILRKKDIGTKDARSANFTEQGKQKKNGDDLKQQSNSDNLQSNGSRTVSRHRRRLDRFEARRAQLPSQSANQDSENDEVEKPAAGCNAFDGNRQSEGNHSETDTLNQMKKGKDFLSSLGDVTKLNPGVEFSSGDARAFLVERWKEAVKAHHVKLVISSELKPTGGST